MPGRGDGKRNGSEERNWGSQCFSTLNEMRQPRDALLLTPQDGARFHGYVSFEIGWIPIGHEHRKVLLFANPSIPLVGMGRPTTSLSTLEARAQWSVGGPVPATSPQNKETVRVEFPFIRLEFISDAPDEASFPCLLGWFTRAQELSTGRNTVRETHMITNSRQTLRLLSAR
ncbi:hypothetical protein Tco_0969428 [Tanacetum coccineum]